MSIQFHYVFTSIRGVEYVPAKAKKVEDAGKPITIGIE